MAEQLLEHTVPRPGEAGRVLSLLKNGKCGRLLLEGPSGAGKSVLLAQIYIDNRTRAVFVSNDVKLAPLEDGGEPGPGLQESGDEGGRVREFGRTSGMNAPKASVALRVGMHALAVLNRLMGFPPPNHELPLQRVQDALRDNLADFKSRRPEARFMVLVDGLNQATDPGDMLGALPDPLPDNLFVLASSQKQERVKGPLTLYYRQDWQFTDMSQLAHAEAEAVVRRFWTRNIEGQKTPEWDQMPGPLRQKLYEKSNGLPIFLRDWTERLRLRWLHDPEIFQRHAEHEFDRRYAELIPETLKSGFEAVREDFDPPDLLDALMWCFSLIPRSLAIDELHDAIRTLRRKGLAPNLPAVSRQQISDALTRTHLGGFLRRMDTGMDQAFGLAHEIMGHWFCFQYRHPEQIPEYRLALVHAGAIPLPENAADGEYKQWYSWVEEEDYDHYQALEPRSRISVCESLLARFEEGTPEHAMVTAHLVWVFLTGTGEQERGFLLAPLLEKAAEANRMAPRVLSEIWQRLGDISAERQKTYKALERYLRSLTIRESLLTESDTLRNRRELTYTLNCVGDVHRDLGQPGKALEFYQRSLAIRESLLAESDTPQNRRDVAVSLNCVGDVHRDIGQPGKAFEFYQRSLAIRESLLAESDTPQNRRDVAVAPNRVGDVHRDLGQPGKALEFYQRSLEMSESLLTGSDTPRNRRELTYTLNRVGDVHRDLDQPGKAFEFYQRSLAIRESLLVESDTPRNRRDVAVALNRVGDVHRDQCQPGKALEFYQRSLGMSESLLVDSDTPRNRRDVAVFLNRLGLIYGDLDHSAKALEFYERYLAMSESLLKNSDTLRNRREMTVALNNLGDVHRDLGQPGKALEFYLRSFESRKETFRKYGTNQALKDLLIGAEKLMALHREQKTAVFATGNDPWAPEILSLFRERVWRSLATETRECLFKKFPQMEIVRSTLSGSGIAARPTLGFTIAACQSANQPHLLYTFIDFDWWDSQATPEQKSDEQLLELRQDIHGWGIIRDTIPEMLKLSSRTEFDEGMKCGIEQGLACGVSLSMEVKQRVVTSWPNLSKEQVAELARIFRQEQIKFALLLPSQQLQLAQLVEKTWEMQA